MRKKGAQASGGIAVASFVVVGPINKDSLQQDWAHEVFELGIGSISEPLIPVEDAEQWKDVAEEIFEIWASECDENWK
jgi:hypothetical protein